MSGLQQHYDQHAKTGKHPNAHTIESENSKCQNSLEFCACKFIWLAGFYYRPVTQLRGTGVKYVSGLTLIIIKVCVCGWRVSLTISIHSQFSANETNIQSDSETNQTF